MKPKPALHFLKTGLAMKKRAILTILSILVIFPFYFFVPSLKRDRDRYRGDEKFKAGQWEKSVAFYERVLHYQNHFPKVLARLGYCYLKLGDTTRAVTYLKQSLLEDSTRLRTLRWLGDASIGKKQWKAAAGDFSKIIHLYRAHHTLSSEEAADYLYALDRLVFCQLKMKQDSLALRQLHDFASVLRTKVKP